MSKNELQRRKASDEFNDADDLMIKESPFQYIFLKLIKMKRRREGRAGRES